MDATQPAGSGHEWESTTTRDGYDRWSQIYDDEDNALIALEEPRIAAMLGDVAGLKIADIGCGTGRHAIRLAAAGARVTALDFSPGMLAKAKAKPGAQAITWIHRDLTPPLPFENGTFDRVLCCLVLDHIAHLTEFLAELKRICRKDGRVIISVMHPAMMLRGVQARFTDPQTGREVRPASYPHQLSNYVLAALRAGLHISHMSEHAVDAPLAARMTRANKYLGWPVLLLVELAPSPF